MQRMPYSCCPAVSQSVIERWDPCGKSGFRPLLTWCPFSVGFSRHKSFLKGKERDYGISLHKCKVQKVDNQTSKKVYFFISKCPYLWAQF
jgi:hypothetical protein